MLVIGVNGGLDAVESSAVALGEAENHDSAAVLLRDGQIVAAFEEERLNRIKHTNKFPANAIKACLEVAGVPLAGIDRFAFYTAEEMARAGLALYALTGRSVARALRLEAAADANPRRLLQALLEREVGGSVLEERIHFVRHHVAHAFSALGPSGFERALVVTLDGQGDREAGYVASAGPEGLEILQRIGVPSSLGHFYSRITALLGFDQFDEYKVMGLAPYGDPASYRERFERLYTLGPRGSFELHPERLLAMFASLEPRQADQPILPRHQDLAAALQETLERIVFHLLEHHRAATALTDLCLAGGVAHNCTLNGKILASGLFSRVFVQPAAHDAGCAWGAALFASGARPGPSAAPLADLYLGNDLGPSATIAGALAAWEPLLSIRRSDDVAAEAAQLLAEGKVIGWAQGRAEFGPRALGNRSILADPRPPANKERINAMVKKREGFRPFAPAVLAERAPDFFELPPQTRADLSHMTYVVKVRAERQALLGAVTHVDGTARVQTVAREVNPRFWRLISEFSRLTDVPVLLNTSFNNNAEPIVDSVQDAVVCFLTTGLDRLVVGDFVVEKGALTPERCRLLVPALCRHVSLQRIRASDGPRGLRERFQLGNSQNGRTVPISPAMWQLLQATDGRQTLAELLPPLMGPVEECFGELVELWARRLITLVPAT
jgi:carbamoyltransferase